MQYILVILFGAYIFALTNLGLIFKPKVVPPVVEIPQPPVVVKTEAPKPTPSKPKTTASTPPPETPASPQPSQTVLVAPPIQTIYVPSAPQIYYVEVPVPEENDTGEGDAPQETPPPVASQPPPAPYVPNLAIQIKVNGEEGQIVEVDAGEITLYWLMSGETGECQLFLPNDVIETVKEEGTKKITVQSDFIFKVGCTGQGSGSSIKKSVEIKIK